MCILLCYTYSACPHVAKSGIYTCYKAKTSGRGFDEKCVRFKITRQKLRLKKEPKSCGDCLEAFGATWLVKRKRVKDMEEFKDAEVEGGSGSGSDSASGGGGEAKAENIDGDGRKGEKTGERTAEGKTASSA